MKCFRCFSFVLFALLGFFFGSFIINQNDTYAAEDITVTFNQYTSSASICSSNCSSYKYLIIKTHNMYSSNPWSFNGQSLKFNLFWNNSFSSAIGLRGSIVDSVLELSPPSSSSDVLSSVDLSSFPAQSSLDTLSSGWSFDVTLSENNPYSSGSIPSGSIELTENGTYDVTNYAEAVVNVPETDCPSGGGGNYHEDLVAINNSIMICAATCLVIYFFYCIYRMIIKNSGVK